MIALATKHNWKLYQLDVKYVFLNVELKEEAYLAHPEGFVKKGNRDSSLIIQHIMYQLAPKYINLGKIITHIQILAKSFEETHYFHVHY